MKKVSTITEKEGMVGKHGVEHPKLKECMLPTLEELRSLMEAENLELNFESPINAYSVYSVYSSGPC